MVGGTNRGYIIGNNNNGVAYYNKALIIIFTYIIFILLLEGFSRFKVSYILKLYKTFISILFIELYLIELFKVVIILRRIDSY